MAEPIARDSVVNGLANDQAKGAVVHTFSPNATPEEKAAAAGKGAQQLKTIAGANKTNGDSAAPGTSLFL